MLQEPGFSWYPEVALRHSCYRTLPRSSHELFLRIAEPIAAKFLLALSKNDGDAASRAFFEYIQMPYVLLSKTRGGSKKRKNRESPLNVKLKQLLNKLIAGEPLQGPKPAAVRVHPVADDPAAEADTRKVRRAKQFIRDGHFSRALRSLQQPNNLVDPNNQLVQERFVQLHPACPDPMPQLPDNAPMATVLPDEDFTKLMLQLANGAAPGLSGNSGDLLALFAKNEVTRAFAAKVVECLINGTLPPACFDMVTMRLLIGAPKHGDSNNPRPLVMAEAMYRLAESVLAQKIRPIAHGLLNPGQKGCFVPGGAEQVVHAATVRAAVPGNAIIQLDIRNAFNEFNRAAFLRRLQNTPELAFAWRFMFRSLTTPPRLYTVSDGRLLWMIESLNGACQGDKLAPFQFAFAAAPAFVEAERLDAKDHREDPHPDGKASMMQYADNIVIMGPAAPALRLAAHVISTVQKPRFGLQVRPDQSSFTWLHDELPPGVAEELERLHIPLSRGPSSLLGSVIGKVVESAEKLQQEVLPVLRDTIALLRHHEISLQESLHVVRTCINTEIDHKLRTTLPASIKPLAHDFDTLKMDFLTDKLDLTPSEVEEASQQLALPFGFNGIGLTSAEEKADTCWLASVIANAAEIRDACVDDCLQWDWSLPVEEGNQPLPAIIKDQLVDSLATVAASIDPETAAEVLPRPESTFMEFYCREDGDFRRLQRVLNHDRFRQTFNRMLLAADGTPMHAAMLASRATYANATLLAVPRTDNTTLFDKDLRLFIRARLGLQPMHDLPTHCAECIVKEPGGEAKFVELKDRPHHLYSCRLNKGGMTYRHNCTCGVIIDSASRAGYCTRKEPRSFCEDQKLRVDWELISGAGHVLGDVTIADPRAETHFRQYRVAGSLAQSCERDKVDKYRVLPLPPGFRFEPVAIEATGGFGDRAKALVDKIAHHAQGRSIFSPAEIKTELIWSIAVAVARGNADYVETVAQRLRSRD